ncbi:hypothetical protein HY837_06935 [archaeon]|nr:hypothetical protein [archaeon]
MNEKLMKDSVLEQKLAFETNPELKKQYVNLVGNMRFGLLLEYLDLLAGETAFHHVDDGRFLRLVTASIDKMNICHPISVDKDVCFKSRVVYVGKSSVNVEINISNTDASLANASFTMVALDELFKPVEVRKVTPESKEEIAAYEKAKNSAEEYKARKKERENLIFTQEEYELMSKFASGVEGKAMISTRKQNIGPMYSQNQNIYGKIFGGYLMKEAFELAWTTAFDFLDYKLRPLIVSIDRIDFKKPVEIGDIVELNSVICHTGETSLSAEVSIRKVHSNIDEGEVTNNCYFTFVAADEKGQKQKVPQVIPVTLPEAKKYMEAHRRYLSRKQ